MKEKRALTFTSESGFQQGVKVILSGPQVVEVTPKRGAQTNDFFLNLVNLKIAWWRIGQDEQPGLATDIKHGGSRGECRQVDFQVF